MAVGCSVFVILLLLAAAVPQQTWGLRSRRGAPTADTPDCSSLDADVLILGAGVTGIVAGKTLSENNITNFIILEGMPDIGGRVRSVPFGGVNVELGASWIQGVLGDNDTEVNPLWPLKVQYDLEGFLTDYGALVLYGEDGTRIPDDDVEKVEKRMNKAYNRIEREARQRRRKENLGTFLFAQPCDLNSGSQRLELSCLGSGLRLTSALQNPQTCPPFFGTYPLALKKILGQMTSL